MPRSRKVRVSGTLQNRQPAVALVLMVRFVSLQARERGLRCSFSALEAVVGPQVSPIAVTAAVAHADVVEIAVDRRKRLRPIVIEDDVRILGEGRILMQ